MKYIIQYFVIAIIAIVFVGYNTIFTINQTQQVIILQFGEPKRVIKEAGLNWKIPFIQDIIVFDNRILDLDPPEFEVLLTDKKRINVDAYARYKIINPLIFYKRVRKESKLRYVFGKSLNAALRRVIATVSLSELLSDKRKDSMKKIEREIQIQAVSLGIELVDVRIGRTNLPEGTAQSVYNRMRTEREREAKEARAEGAEIAQKIRSKANRNRTIMLANAERKAEILRGEGDAKKNNILANAYSEDPEFFEFYKSMRKYKEALLGDGNSVMIISPNNDFFKYLNSP